MGGGDINPKGTSGRHPDEVGRRRRPAGIYGRERVKVLSPHGLERERVNTSAASVQVMFSLSKIILICRGDNVRRFKGHYFHPAHLQRLTTVSVKGQLQLLNCKRNHRCDASTAGLQQGPILQYWSEVNTKVYIF